MTRDQDEVESNSLKRTVLKNIFLEFWKDRALFVCGAATVILYSLFTNAQPRILGWGVDHALVPRDGSQLKKVCLFLLVAELGRILFLISQSLIFERMGSRAVARLRERLYQHLLSLPVRVFDQMPSGRLSTRIINDVGAMNELFSAGIVSFIGNALVVLTCWISLLSLDIGLAWVSLLTVPVMIGASVYFSKKIHLAFRDSRTKLSAMNSFLAENIQGIRVTQLFNRVQTQMDRFSRLNEHYFQAQVGTTRLYAFFQPLVTLLSGMAIALVMVKGSGLTEVGVYVAFLAYVQLMYQPVREMIEKWNVFLSGLSGAERVFELLSWEREPDAPPAVLHGSEIEFKNVWFKYLEDGDWIIRDLSFKLEAGKKLGIVGHTGAGKSTILQLLFGFYLPQKGQITVGGVDISHMSRAQLRGLMGWVSQDVFLFQGSLSDNITFWGDRELGRDAISVLNLESLDHPLEERAVNLSLGERQKIALARALVKRPAIWVLDEATANVDSVSEDEMMRELLKLSAKNTVISIAHRLSTVRHCDSILVMADGVKSEWGSHEELEKKNGVYAKMLRLTTAKHDSELGAAPIQPV